MQNTNEILQLQPVVLQTSLQQDYPVRISAARTRREKDLKVLDQGYSFHSSNLLAIISPDMSYWKIPQCLFTQNKYSLFSGSLPSSGMMRNGKLYLSARLSFRMREKDLFSLPTVVKSDGRRVTQFSQSSLLKSALKHKNKTNLFGINLAEEILLLTGLDLSPNLCRLIQGFPKNWLENK